MSSAWVLEVAADNGNALVIVGPTVESLRQGWSTEDDPDFFVFFAADLELRATAEGEEPAPAVFRVWRIDDGRASAPLDARPFVRLSEGGLSTSLDQLAPFAEPGLSRDVRIDIDWERLSWLLPPLTGESLQPGDVMHVDFSAHAARVHVPSPLSLGTNHVFVD